MSEKKNFVIDTNILLLDPRSIFKFQDNNVIIPMIVLEELDNKKTVQGAVGYNAREVSRLLDKLSNPDKNRGKLSEGAELNEGGVLFVYECENANDHEKNDNKIIAHAQFLKETSFGETILVSNDCNVRLKARSMDILAEGYEPSDIKIKDKNFKGFKNISSDESNEGFGDFYENEYVNVEGKLGRISGGQMRALKYPDNLPVKAMNDEQHFVLDALTDPKIKLVTITGKAGTGKSQPLSEPVLTPEGYVNMGSVKKGDYVIGSDGKPTMVESIHPQGELEIFEVEFSDGSSTRCSEDHLWDTRTSLERDQKKDFSTKTTKDIMNTLLYGKLSKKNHSIPMVKPVDSFTNDGITVSPYLLGFLLGDGHFGNNMYFSTADEEVVDTLGELLPETDTIVKVSDYDYRIKRKVRNNSKSKTLSDILDLGLGDVRSDNKFIPNNYLFSSLDTRISILQGLLDSDGTLDYRTGYNVTFSSTSEELTTGVMTLVQSLGGTAIIKNRYTNYTYKGVKKAGKLSYRISIKLPKEINPFKLKRKASTYIPNKKYTPIRYITKVSPVGIEECQCIKVDAKDSLYVTNNFIVTHNTLLAAAAGLTQVLDSNFRKLVIARPIMPMGNDIGFLPGSKDDKLAVWMQPLFDNLEFMAEDRPNEKGVYSIEDMMEEGILQLEALTYIRGRTFHNQFLIIDEAQNLSALEIKTIITRAGDNTKIVLTGDTEQIDSPHLDAHNNGLSLVVDRFKSFGLAAHIHLEKCERSELAEFAAENL